MAIVAVAIVRIAGGDSGGVEWVDTQYFAKDIASILRKVGVDVVSHGNEQVAVGVEKKVVDIVSASRLVNAKDFAFGNVLSQCQGVGGRVGGGVFVKHAIVMGVSVAGVVGADAWEIGRRLGLRGFGLDHEEDAEALGLWHGEIRVKRGGGEAKRSKVVLAG